MAAAGGSGDPSSGTALDEGDGLGIAELARLTGLDQQVLRAWEARYGFPAPRRTASGRRRYDEDDVERVLKVTALRDSGVRLAHAVERVTAEQAEGPQSVYAELRRRHPELQTRVLRRDVLVAVSHAIEDEALSRAVRPTVFGAFQREEYYRRAAARWEEIARTATSCHVFADFPEVRDGAPVEVPLAPDAPLIREWAVVVGSAGFSAALTAWELPGPAVVDPRQRAFESIFTLDPAAVRTAALVCTAVARDAGVALDDMPEHASPETTTRATDALVLRAFDYLQQITEGP